jgi:hypothetical protein
MRTTALHGRIDGPEEPTSPATRARTARTARGQELRHRFPDRFHLVDAEHRAVSPNGARILSRPFSPELHGPFPCARFLPTRMKVWVSRFWPGRCLRSIPESVVTTVVKVELLSVVGPAC